MQYWCGVQYNIDDVLSYNSSGWQSRPRSLEPLVHGDGDGTPGPSAWTNTVHASFSLTFSLHSSDWLFLQLLSLALTLPAVVTPASLSLRAALSRIQPSSSFYSVLRPHGVVAANALPISLRKPIAMSNCDTKKKLKSWTGM